MTQINEWATVEELAAHYIARVHQIAHEMRYSELEDPRGALQSEKSWRQGVEAKKEAARSDMEMLRQLAKDLVPDPARYAEISQQAIARAADVSCTACYGRLVMPVDHLGSKCFTSDRTMKGVDGVHYHLCQNFDHGDRVRKAKQVLASGGS